MDVLFTLHTGYVTPTGAIVISHWFIAWNYVKTRLVLDVLVTLPLVMHANRSNLSDFGGKWVTFALDILTVERLAYVTRFVRMIWLVRANQSGAATISGRGCYTHAFRTCFASPGLSPCSWSLPITMPAFGLFCCEKRGYERSQPFVASSILCKFLRSTVALAGRGRAY